MGKSSGKRQKGNIDMSKRSLRLSASNVGERGTMPPNVPQRKKEIRSCKSLKVTWNYVNQVKKNLMAARNALTLQPFWQVSLRNYLRKRF